MARWFWRQTGHSLYCGKVMWRFVVMNFLVTVFARRYCGLHWDRFLIIWIFSECAAFGNSKKFVSSKCKDSQESKIVQEVVLISSFPLLSILMVPIVQAILLLFWYREWEEEHMRRFDKYKITAPFVYCTIEPMAPIKWANPWITLPRNPLSPFRR